MVLLAALRLGQKAYGVAIRNEIERQTGHVLPQATIYAVLERLLGQGYLLARHGDPTPERGGRSKLFVAVTRDGRQALQQSLRSVDALRTGIRVLGVTT